jgi:hypothetical protein
LPLAENLFPIVILRVAGAKGEHGVGKRITAAVARCDADNHGAVVAALDGIRIEIHPLCSKLTASVALSPRSIINDAALAVSYQPSAFGYWPMAGWLAGCLKADR